MRGDSRLTKMLGSTFSEPHSQAVEEWKRTAESKRQPDYSDIIDSVRFLSTEPHRNAPFDMECKFSFARGETSGPSLTSTNAIHVTPSVDEQVSNVTVKQPFAFNLCVDADHIVVEVTTVPSEYRGVEGMTLRRGSVKIPLRNASENREELVLDVLNDLGTPIGNTKLVLRLYRITKSTFAQQRLSVHIEGLVSSALRILDQHLPAGKLLLLPSLASESVAASNKLVSPSLVRSINNGAIIFRPPSVLNLEPGIEAGLAAMRRVDPMGDCLLALATIDVDAVLVRLSDVRVRAHASFLIEARQAASQHVANVLPELADKVGIPSEILLKWGIHNGEQFILHPAGASQNLVLRPVPPSGDVPPGPGDFEGAEPSADNWGRQYTDLIPGVDNPSVMELNLPTHPRTALYFALSVKFPVEGAPPGGSDLIIQFAQGVVLPKRHVWSQVTSKNLPAVNDSLNLASSSIHSSSNDVQSLTSWFMMDCVRSEAISAVSLTGDAIKYAGRSANFALHLSMVPGNADAAKQFVTRQGLRGQDASDAAPLAISSAEKTSYAASQVQQIHVDAGTSGERNDLLAPDATIPLKHPSPVPYAAIDQQASKLVHLGTRHHELIQDVTSMDMGEQVKVASPLLLACQDLIKAQRDIMQHYKIGPERPLSAMDQFATLYHEKTSASLKLLEKLLTNSKPVSPDELNAIKTLVDATVQFSKSKRIPAVQVPDESQTPEDSSMTHAKGISADAPHNAPLAKVDLPALQSHPLPSVGVPQNVRAQPFQIPDPHILAAMTPEQRSIIARLRQRELAERHVSAGISGQLSELSANMASSRVQLDPASAVNLSRRYKALSQQMTESELRMSRLRGILEELESTHLMPASLHDLENDNQDLFATPVATLQSVNTPQLLPGYPTPNLPYPSNIPAPHLAGPSMYSTGYVNKQDGTLYATSREVSPPQWGAGHPDHPMNQKLATFDNSLRYLPHGQTLGQPEEARQLPLFLQRAAVSEAQVATLVGSAPEAFGAAFNTALDPLGRRRAPIQVSLEDGIVQDDAYTSSAPAAGFVPSGLPVDWMLEATDPLQADEISLHFLQFQPRSRALLGAANKSMARQGGKAGSSFEFSSSVRIATRFFLFPPMCTPSASVSFSPFSKASNATVLRASDSGEPLSLSFLIGPQTTAPNLARYQLLDLQEPHPYRHHHDANHYDPRASHTSMAATGHSCCAGPLSKTMRSSMHHTSSDIHNMRTASGGFNETIYTKPMHADTRYKTIAENFGITGVPNLHSGTSGRPSDTLEEKFHSTHMELVRYMYGRCLEVEVWGSGDAIHLGSAFVPLAGLIRQQRPVVKEIFTYPVLDVLTGELMGELTVLATCIGHKIKTNLPRTPAGNTSAIDTRFKGSVDSMTTIHQPAPASSREQIARVKAVRLSDTGLLHDRPSPHTFSTDMVAPRGGEVNVTMDETSRKVARFNMATQAGGLDGPMKALSTTLYKTSGTYNNFLTETGRGHTLMQITGLQNTHSVHGAMLTDDQNHIRADDTLFLTREQASLKGTHGRTLETMARASALREAHKPGLIRDVLAEFRRENLVIEPSVGVAFFFVLEFHNPFDQETSFQLDIQHPRKPPSEDSGRFTYDIGRNTGHFSTAGEFAEEDDDARPLPVVIPISGRPLPASMGGGAGLYDDDFRPEPLLQPELTVCSDPLEWYAGVKRQTAMVQNSFLDQTLNSTVSQGEALVGMAGLLTSGTLGAFHNNHLHHDELTRLRNATVQELAAMAFNAARERHHHGATSGCSKCSDKAHQHVFGQPVPNFGLAEPLVSPQQNDPWQPRRDGTAQKYIFALRPHEQVFIPFKFFSVVMTPPEEAISGFLNHISVSSAPSTISAQRLHATGLASKVSLPRPECMALERSSMSLRESLQAWQSRVAKYARMIAVQFKRTGKDDMQSASQMGYGVDFMGASEAQLLREVNVTVVPRPVIVDSVIRLFAEEGSTLTREASLCIPVPSESAPVSNAARMARTMHATGITTGLGATNSLNFYADAPLPLGMTPANSYVICTDSAIAISGFEPGAGRGIIRATSNPNSAFAGEEDWKLLVGEHGSQFSTMRIRMSINVRNSTSTGTLKPRRFLLLFYHRNAPSTLACTVLVQVTGLRRETASLTVGTSMFKHIALPQGLMRSGENRRIRLVTTDESLCQIDDPLPNTPFYAGQPTHHENLALATRNAALTRTEFRVKLSPSSAGNQVCRVHAIDDDSGELVAAWAIQVDGKLPEVAQSHSLYVPPGRISRRSIMIRNPLGYEATFCLRSSVPVVLQVATPSVRIGPGAAAEVELSICAEYSAMSLLSEGGVNGGDPMSRFRAIASENRALGSEDIQSLGSIEAYVFVNSELAEVTDVHMIKVFVTRQA